MARADSIRPAASRASRPIASPRAEVLVAPTTIPAAITTATGASSSAEHPPRCPSPAGRHPQPCHRDHGHDLVAFAQIPFLEVLVRNTGALRGQPA